MSYKLSTELTGHTNDVRVVSSYKLGGNEAIITASRDGTARVWQQTETLEYSVVKTLTGHTGPVTAITILPADELAGRNKSEMYVHARIFFIVWVGESHLNSEEMVWQCISVVSVFMHSLCAHTHE